MRKLVNTVLAGALGLTMIAGVTAQDVPSDEGEAIVQITSDETNTLTVSITEADFGQHAYSFNEQAATANITVDVLDNRGTNAGWTVSLSAEGNLEGANTGEFVPLSGLSLAAGTVTGPEPEVGQPATEIATMPLNPVGTVGQPILTADDGEGAGEYEFGIEGTLLIPGGQVIDTYSTTLTITVPEAP